MVKRFLFFGREVTKTHTGSLRLLGRNGFLGCWQFYERRDEIRPPGRAMALAINCRVSPPKGWKNSFLGKNASAAAGSGGESGANFRLICLVSSVPLRSMHVARTPAATETTLEGIWRMQRVLCTIPRRLVHWQNPQQSRRWQSMNPPRDDGPTSLDERDTAAIRDG